VRSDFDIGFWEYPWYFLTTVFLSVVGVGLAVLGLIRGIFGLRRKPLFTWRSIISFSIIAGSVAVIFVFSMYTTQVDLGARAATVVVQTGDRFSSVVDQLVREKVVESKWLLTYPARFLRIDRKLLPGTYIFTGKNSAKSVLDKLERGDVLLMELTIPEGSPIWRVGSILQMQLALDSAALQQLNADKAFLDSLDLPYLEGYIFPETYLFAQGVSLRTVVREMVRMFHQKTDSLWENPTPTGLDERQTMILASIVEAETPLAAERNRVASVYMNRLRLEMPLDADPTVIYGMGGLDRPLLRADLDKVTPYNTYRMQGLPPTPINSPGLESIRAALRPDSADHLFFVADGTGSGAHIFSRSNDEHNAARKRAKINGRRTP
jgi:UPF0755 protein